MCNQQRHGAAWGKGKGKELDMTRWGVAAAVAVTVGVGAFTAAAPAQADFRLPGIGECNYPGTSGGVNVFGFGGKWCDYPPVLDGQHYHCEWVMVTSGCTWRWANNTLAPPPPPEQIFW
jgi:hypothetical protein